jgi:hypothetical protein
MAEPISRAWTGSSFVDGNFIEGLYQVIPERDDIGNLIRIPSSMPLIGRRYFCSAA